jgi:hypothetical protein
MNRRSLLRRIAAIAVMPALPTRIRPAMAVARAPLAACAPPIRCGRLRRLGRSLA